MVMEAASTTVAFGNTKSVMEPNSENGGDGVVAGNVAVEHIHLDGGTRAAVCRFLACNSLNSCCRAARLLQSSVLTTSGTVTGILAAGGVSAATASVAGDAGGFVEVA